MELLQLKYFIECAHVRNITKTAKKLFVAQPDLSQTIARLEKELGTKLLDRSRSGVSLTPSGEYFLERVEPLVNMLDDASQMLKLFGDNVNRTIYLNVLVASQVANDIIIKYKKKHPDVIFKIKRDPEDTAWSLRISGYRGDAVSSIPESRTVLFSERVMLAVPMMYDIARNDEIDLKETAVFPYVTYSENMPYNELCKRLWEEAEINPPIILESDNPQAMREMVCAGIGVAFWPEFSWGKQKSSKMKLMKINATSASRAVTIEKNSKLKLTSAEEDFFRFICAESQRNFGHK